MAPAPLTSKAPSGEKATELSGSVCPVSVRRSLFVAKSHSLIVRSALAEARMAQEEHRYGIRSNAILAQSYERVVGAGVERLALYYKGGLKPEVVAQLVQSAATLGLIPAVLTR